MRKAILVFVASAFVSFTYAQDANFDVELNSEPSEKVICRGMKRDKEKEL